MTEGDYECLTAFDSGVLAKLGRAYGKAITFAGADGEQTETQDRIAENILALAEDGVNDEERMSALAVVQVTEP